MNFRDHGTPQTPADLVHHRCIRNIHHSGAPYARSFSRNGESVDFEPIGPLSLDDQDLILGAAVSGAALAYVWEGRARPLIEAGRLAPCLDAWCAPEDWLHIHCPNRRHMSAGLRVVVDALGV